MGKDLSENALRAQRKGVVQVWLTIEEATVLAGVAAGRGMPPPNAVTDKEAYELALNSAVAELRAVLRRVEQ